MNTVPEVGFRQKRTLPLGIEIIKLEELRSRLGMTNHDPYLPHKVSFNIIMMVTEGKGKHFIDFTAYYLKPGDLVFISQGAVQQFSSDFLCNGWALFFTFDFLKQNLLINELFLINFLLNISLQTRFLHLESNDISFYEAFFNYLIEEFSSNEQSHQNQMLHSYLKIMLVKTIRIIENMGKGIETDTDINLILELNELLDRHGKMERSAGWYAGKIGKTYKVLNSLCIKLLAQPLKQYISRNIILQIQRELATTDISLKELCWKFNFDEPTNFTKYYKRYTSGETPSDFRTKINNPAKPSI